MGPPCQAFLGRVLFLLIMAATLTVVSLNVNGMPMRVYGTDVASELLKSCPNFIT